MAKGVELWQSKQDEAELERAIIDYLTDYPLPIDPTPLDNAILAYELTQYVFKPFMGRKP